MRKPFLTSGLFGLLTNLPDQSHLLAPADAAIRQELGARLRQALADAATCHADDRTALATLRRAIAAAGTALPAGSTAAARLARLLEQSDARAQHDEPTRALQFIAAELAERIADLTFVPIEEWQPTRAHAGYIAVDELELVTSASADGGEETALRIGARGIDSTARVQELRLRLERWLHRAGCEWQANGPFQLRAHNSPAVGAEQRWFEAWIPVCRRAG
ncbi:MAG: hypothetical protein IPK26_24170 [Planctomycetes bacterium]|nr:hypothetical protein [Planctomycetota bacterium]